MQYHPAMAATPSQAARPHRLELYRHAVQHPLAEVAFLQRVHGGHGRQAPRVLREDFAGGAAVSIAWVQLDPERSADAVELHQPTLRWAARQTQQELGCASEQVRFHHGDVRSTDTQRCDVIAALNFSVLGLHTRAELLDYFRRSRARLRAGGVLVLDVYGGPGAEQVSTQRRRVQPMDGALPTFTYLWEQRSFDALTRRTDCRIHFDLPGRQRWASAFRYDWRLWTLPELRELLHEAGYRSAEVWCDSYDAMRGRSDGVYRPQRKLPARHDWVAYVVGRR